MAELDFKLEFYRSAPADGPARPLRSKIDNASTNDENKRHWANADALGPNAALDPGTRSRLRNRGRYEATNNAYCHGLVRSLAYDLIGTGPRPQLSIPGKDADAKIVERKFKQWARADKFGRALRIMEKSAVREGEIFALLDTNARQADPVQLHIKLVESDQCAAAKADSKDPYLVDGIKYDQNWLPLTYFFLRSHPGEAVLPGSPVVPIPAENVLHWFDPDRAGQLRGIPKITASLGLFAQMRRFTQAVITSAEFAAMLAGVMKSNMPPVDGAGATVENWEMFEMVRGALLTLPEGWEATQFRAEQPQSTYADFKREILNEAGRSAGAPLNVVSGNSSGYNYSSGRLDHLPYQRGLRVDREDLRDIVLDPVFRAWYAEASAIAGHLPAGLPPIEEWAWTWNYDGFDSIDQNKDATADDTRLKNGTSTYAEIFAAYGQDWQEEFDQLAREKEYALAKGLPWPVLSDGGTATGEATTTIGDDGEEITVPGAAASKNGTPAKSATAAAKTGDVQASALDGAQIASLILLTDKLAFGQYPADAVEAEIQASFPLMDRKLIATIVKSLDAFAKKNPRPADPASPPPSRAAALNGLSGGGVH